MENTYYTNATQIDEMIRLEEQGQQFTKIQGGTLCGIDTTAFADVLDLACGSGEWVLQTAKEYPHLLVTGIDNTPPMIERAQQQALQEKRYNANFLVVSITPTPPESPIASIERFHDNSYDLINERLIATAIKKVHWPWLISQCSRLLRPNGILRMTECNDYSYQDAPNMSHLNALFVQAMKNYGHLPTDEHFIPTLKTFLAQFHFTIEQEQPLEVDFSPGSPSHQALVRTSQLALDKVLTFIKKNTEEHPQRLKRIFDGAQRELTDGHEMRWFGMTIIARKSSTP